MTTPNLEEAFARARDLPSEAQKAVALLVLDFTARFWLAAAKEFSGAARATTEEGSNE